MARTRHRHAPPAGPQRGAQPHHSSSSRRLPNDDPPPLHERLRAKRRGDLALWGERHLHLDCLRRGAGLVQRHRRVGHCRKPGASEALVNGGPARGLGAHHANHQAHQVSGRQRLAPRAHEPLQPLVALAVQVGEQRVDKHRPAEGRVARQQDEEADARGEDIRRARLVAPDLRAARLGGHRVRRQLDLAEVATSHLHHGHVAWGGPGGSGDANLGGGGHVALRPPVVVLAHCAVEPERRPGGGVAPHRHAEVHEPDLAVLQQHVIEGDVAVADLVPVQVRHGLQRLPRVDPDLGLLQTAGGGDPEQLAAVAELRDEPGEVRRREDTLHPEDVGRHVGLLGQVGQHADLRQRVLGLGRLLARPQVRGPLVPLGVELLVKVRDAQLLHRHVPLALAIPPPAVPEDAAVNALGQLADEGEVATSQRLEARRVRPEITQVADAGVTRGSHELQDRVVRSVGVNRKLLLDTVSEELLLLDRHA
mmetsp:Transcript_95340/g.246402  ORF Transcript_95340/g.246402 Transcript_95340/m.246402 type:complete len:479 (-) Transcript_95340:354-1790(-)